MFIILIAKDFKQITEEVSCAKKIEFVKTSFRIFFETFFKTFSELSYYRSYDVI